MPPSLAPARSRSVHRFSFFSSLSDHLIANDASGASIRRRRNPPVDLCLRKNGGGRGKEERACFFLPPSHPNIKILLLQKHERKKREGGKGKRNGKTAVGAFLRPRLSALTNSSPTFGSNGKVIMRSQLGKKRGRRGGSDRACPWGGGGRMGEQRQGCNPHLSSPIKGAMEGGTGHGWEKEKRFPFSMANSRLFGRRRQFVEYLTTAGRSVGLLRREEPLASLLKVASF